MEKIKCYIYTRVSTSIQIDGYSLDAQKDEIYKYIKAYDYEVAGEYSDEGKSGKNIEGRPQFRQMLHDIENKKDDVKFVLVYKLSRFGRNAADVLSSLQLMQDYGVNLICVEDKIDSSKDAGKLMITILSSVAELERENIRTQTMAGREEKAREGKWNGGYAPYGYDLVEGKLVIAETEAEHVRLIFDKYVNTTMGPGVIAEWLELNGYKKTVRKNGKLPHFSPDFVKKVIDNPVYCGDIAYGRRKTEKIDGKRNEFHIVKQAEYPVYQGIHDAIVSKDIWDAAQAKRKQTGGVWIKTHSLDHEHLLSGIVKCPMCGGGMFGNVHRKKKKDGSYYKDYFFYRCKHRIKFDGHDCDYNKQWAEYKIDFAVEEVISELVNTPRFKETISSQIDAHVDTESLATELENIKKIIKSKEALIRRTNEDITNIDASDASFENKYQDLTNRLNNLYDDLALYQSKRAETEQRILNIREEKIKTENIYKFLLYFDKLYAKFTDVEKKTFLKTFVNRVDIFPEEQADGRLLKAIKFNFPIFYDDKVIDGLSWDKEGHVESVALFVRADSSI